MYSECVWPIVVVLKSYKLVKIKFFLQLPK